MSDPFHVIVVGAGFTGLSAARELRRRGLSCLVLEARDRVGGRVASAFNALGERIDTGGQFFCEDMPEVTALARSYGKTFIETSVEGRFTAQPKVSAAQAERIYRGAFAMRKRLSALDPDDPAITGLTVADWLARQPDPAEAKASFHSMVEGLWCRAISEIPLWYLIDNDRRITGTAFELQYSLAETMHSLAEDLARDLAGGLRLGTPVSTIAHGSREVVVHAGAESFRARSVLLAVPPGMASRIGFSPELPADLAGALGAWRSGTVAKATIRYKRRFWRDSGLSGMVTWRDVHGLFACEVSRDAAHPALVLWVGGPLVVKWRALGKVPFHSMLTGRLAAALGPQAAAPLDMLVRDWTDDRWSGGGYGDVIVSKDARNAESILREGLDRIRFASSELAPSYPAYIEGAIVAGRAAAEEIAKLAGRG